MSDNKWEKICLYQNILITQKDPLFNTVNKNTK